MKTKLVPILLTLSALSVIAATLTITIPPNDVPRVQEAFGSVLGLTDANGSPRPATQQEVQQAVHQFIINSTKDYERRKNTYQYTPPPMEMQPSPSPTPTATAGGLQAEKAANPTATPKPKK